MTANEPTPLHAPPAAAADDFDQLLGLANRRPFKLQGETHYYPADLPWDATLYLQRLHQEHGAGHEPSLEQLHTLARLTYGAEQVEAWLAGGLGLHGISALMDRTFQVLDEERRKRGHTEAEDTEHPQVARGG